MGEHDDDRLLDDSRGFTKSDLEWLRQARQVITPEAMAWLAQTQKVITLEMLVKLKRRDEQSTAFSLFMLGGGVLMGIFGFDKLAKMLIKVLEFLGNGK